MGISKMDEEIRENYYEVKGGTDCPNIVVGVLGQSESDTSAKFEPGFRSLISTGIWKSAIKECLDCGADFFLSAEEQVECVRRGDKIPQMCKRCRANYKVLSMRGLR